MITTVLHIECRLVAGKHKACVSCQCWFYFYLSVCSLLDRLEVWFLKEFPFSCSGLCKPSLLACQKSSLVTCPSVFLSPLQLWKPAMSRWEEEAREGLESCNQHASDRNSNWRRKKMLVFESYPGSGGCIYLNSEMVTKGKFFFFFLSVPCVLEHHSWRLFGHLVEKVFQDLLWTLWHCSRWMPCDGRHLFQALLQAGAKKLTADPAPALPW